jgi:hypothetical protein
MVGVSDAHADHPYSEITRPSLKAPLATEERRSGRLGDDRDGRSDEESDGGSWHRDTVRLLRGRVRCP